MCSLHVLIPTASTRFGATFVQGSLLDRPRLLVCALSEFICSSFLFPSPGGVGSRIKRNELMALRSSVRRTRPRFSHCAVFFLPLFLPTVALVQNAVKICPSHPAIVLVPYSLAFFDPTYTNQPIHHHVYHAKFLLLLICSSCFLCFF